MHSLLSCTLPSHVPSFIPGNRWDSKRLVLSVIRTAALTLLTTITEEDKHFSWCEPKPLMDSLPNLSTLHMESNSSLLSVFSCFRPILFIVVCVHILYHIFAACSTIYVICVCCCMHSILCSRENVWQFGKLSQDVSMHESEVRVLWHHQGATAGILGARRPFLFVIKKPCWCHISEIDHKDCTCSVVSKLLLERTQACTHKHIHLRGEHTSILMTYSDHLLQSFPTRGTCSADL